MDNLRIPDYEFREGDNPGIALFGVVFVVGVFVLPFLESRYNFNMAIPLLLSLFLAVFAVIIMMNYSITNTRLRGEYNSSYIQKLNNLPREFLLESLADSRISRLERSLIEQSLKG